MDKIDHTSPLSYTAQLEKILIKRIRAKDFDEKGHLPTILELSKIYEVSAITIRRALANLAEKGFIYKRRGKGIFARSDIPNIHLTPKKCSCLALFPSLLTPEYANTITGIENRIEKENDIQLIIRSYGYNTKSEQTYLGKFLRGGYDLLLYRPFIHTDKEYVKSLAATEKPFVLLERRFPDLDTNVCTMDYFHISYLMTKSLLKTGAKNICYVGYPTSPTDQSGACNFIKAGYLKALEDLSFSGKNQIIENIDKGIYNSKTLQGQILGGLRISEELPAFFISHRHLSIPLLRVVERIKGEISPDLRIAGFDLNYSLSRNRIPFITANVKYIEMGYLAADKVVQLSKAEVRPPVKELIRSDILEHDGYRNYQRINAQSLEIDKGSLRSKI